MEKRERQEGITTGQAKGQTQRWQPLQPNLARVNEAAIDPPRVLSEEPTAVTPHGGICGGESQQWLSYPTNLPVRFDERGVETELRLSHLGTARRKGRQTDMLNLKRPRHTPTLRIAAGDLNRRGWAGSAPHRNRLGKGPEREPKPRARNRLHRSKRRFTEFGDERQCVDSGSLRRLHSPIAHSKR
jgi:hypothetical protein